MNEFDVRDLFIHAAQIDRKLPDNARPARLKSQSLPFIHTQAEMNGWGTERLTDDRIESLSKMAMKLQASDVSVWEHAMDLMRLVSRERHRRCLWAYAQSKAGSLRVPDVAVSVENVQKNFKGRVRPIKIRETVLSKISFSKWCRDVEHLHRNYGKMCADHAIAEITFKLSSKTLRHNDFAENSTLQEQAKIRDIRVKLEDVGQTGHRLFHAEPGAWPVQDKEKALHRFDEEFMHFDIEEVRRRDRRQRERRRRAA